MIYVLPWLIATLQGLFLLTLLLPKNVRPRMPLLLFWSALMGMATTTLVTFTSFLFFNQLIPAYVIGLNIAVTVALGCIAKQKGLSVAFAKDNWNKTDIIGIALLIAFNIPVIIHAWLYPDGGWDAWSCWNLKAKFLFMGGDAWHGMMDQALWRSNTAYPFLLPLINVWSWCFGSEPSLTATLITSCAITFIMSGLLFFGLKELGGKMSSILAPLWVLSIMFVVKLASSQYSDLLVGVWLLSALLALRLFYERRCGSYLTIALMNLGFMSFTKSEGLVLSAITLSVFGLAILLSAELKKATLASWKVLCVAAALAFLPTIIFQLFWMPESHTFINGLTSVDKPASIERLKAALMFLGIEMISFKWNGFWFILLGGIVLGGTKAFRRGMWIIPAIIGTYIASVIGVYYINTFFPVIWWLSTTLNRILFALIPMLVFWLFMA